MSLDSFDRFCRSGSVGPEQRKKRTDDGNDDDDDDQEEEEEEKELKLRLDSAIESSESEICFLLFMKHDLYSLAYRSI